MLGKRRRDLTRTPSSSDVGAFNESDALLPPSSSQTSYNEWPVDSDDNDRRKRRHLDTTNGSTLRFPPASKSPPRAPRAMRKRSPSPTPPPPQFPSAEYLALASQSPTNVDSPASSRKLLVLDLNGTLLHRSPHQIRNKQRDYHARDERGNVLPRLRSVHPRPYMGVFRKFLFAPETKEWLDIMVWSSAQPHSVNDMVDKCFGDDKAELIAVWARDTLGLSPADYSRKVQTTKDLAKPWTLLLPKPADPSSPRASIASTQPDTAPSSPSHPLDETADSSVSPAQAHSALTTLLLDDSPRKAELQPHNHFCVSEYTGELRAKDFENLQKEQDWDAAVEARAELDALKAQAEADATAEATAASPESAPATEEVLSVDSPEQPGPDGAKEDGTHVPGSKKRKRRKKLEKRIARLEALGGKPEVAYDETLLAVIGVLSEIKHQANVAAWIRAGGLWGSRGPVSHSSSSSVPAAAEEEDAGGESDTSNLSVGKAGKRQRIRGPSAEVEGVGAGNDAATATPSQTMWFEDTTVMADWAARGRRALEELEIPAEHGLEH